LAKAIGRVLEIRFRFNDGNGEVWPVAKKVVGSLLFAAYRAVASHDDPAIGEGALLIDVIVRPA
jgi:hypothetical protein